MASENKIINKDQPVLGGQAVIEGVLIKSHNAYAVAVRKGKGIVLKKQRISSWTKKPFFNWYVVRGVVNLIEMLGIGMKALNYSAEEALGEKEESSWMFVISILFALVVGVGLFVVLPVYLTKLLTSNTGFLFNVIDGIFRIVIFILYIVAISSMKDVQTLFKYHGAEHMAVHCYEHGKKLTVANVRKYRSMHPRCGTSFIMILLIISIFVFSVITSQSYLVKIAGRLLLLPLIIGISYELLRASARMRDSWVMSLLSAPGIWLQYLTTKRPSDRQIEVAIRALETVLKMEKAR